MAKEKFINYNFSPENEVLVQLAEQTTEEYKAQGYDLSVRQLFYTMVAANRLGNTQKNYSMLVALLTNARMSGRIDWHSIVDRNRSTNDHQYFPSLKSCLKSASRRFRLDKWLKQPNKVEVLIEKAALEGVIQKPCSAHEVPYTACRGYPSATLMYDIAHRMRERYLVGKKTCHVLYLGDHDASGLGISKDIEERLNLLATIPVHVHRIALNMNQIEEMKCPPNPAKMSDSRAKKYVAEHGTSSWELDSLEPSYLGDLVDSSIRMLKDESLWKKELAREMELKEQFQNIIEEVEG